MKKHRLENTSSTADPTSARDLKQFTDITCYPNSVELDEKRRTSWGKTVLTLEAKITSDAFDDKSKRLWEKRDRKSTETRGQMINHATQIIGKQHRLFLINVWISKTGCRFFRWDRAGAVVTEAFNLETDGHLLTNFLHAFDKLDEFQQGMDPRAHKLDPANVDDRLLEEWAKRVFRHSVPHVLQEHAYDVVKLDVPSRGSEVSANRPKYRQFLVQYIISEPRSPIGRGTKGFPALEVPTDLTLVRELVHLDVGDDTSIKEFVCKHFKADLRFLKDAWRSVANEMEMEKESELLETLRSKKCVNIPTFVCGGDLDENGDDDSEIRDSPAKSHQQTHTDLCVTKQWNRNRDDGVNKVEPRRHHRFVVKEFCMPIYLLPDARALLTAVSDAFNGQRRSLLLYHNLTIVQGTSLRSRSERYCIGTSLLGT